MGKTEKALVTWAYVGSAFAIIVGVGSIALSAVTIAIARDDVSLTLRSQAESLGIAMILIAAAAAILGAVAVWQIYKANQVYLQVAQRAVKQSVHVHPASLPAAPAKPNQTHVAATTTKPQASGVPNSAFL